MLKWLLIVAIFAASLMSCFFPEDHKNSITFHTDTSFTDEERKCLIDSGNQWINQTDGLVKMWFKFDYNHNDLGDQVNASWKHWDTLERWATDDSRAQEVDEGLGPDDYLLGQTKGTYTLYTRDHPVKIGIIPDLFKGDQHLCRLVTMHEYGHGLGIMHQGMNESNIMFPTINIKRTACLKADDLSAYCTLYNCGDAHLTPCPSDDLEASP